MTDTDHLAGLQLHVEEALKGQREGAEGLVAQVGRGGLPFGVLGSFTDVYFKRFKDKDSIVMDFSK